MMIKYLFILLVLMGCNQSNNSRAPDSYYLIRPSGDAVFLVQFKSNGKYVFYVKINSMLEEIVGDYEIKKDTIVMYDRIWSDKFESEPIETKWVLLKNSSNERISYVNLEEPLFLDKIDSLTQQHVNLIENIDNLNNDSLSPTK